MALRHGGRNSCGGLTPPQEFLFTPTPHQLKNSRKFLKVSAINLPFLFLSFWLRDKMEEVMVQKPNVLVFVENFKFDVLT